MQTETTSETAEGNSPSRMRFSISTMIVLITISCLVMGNVITASKWYFETQHYQRELAKAQRSTGYLVVDDPTQIQITNVPSRVRGMWTFQFHLPPGRNYWLCYRLGDIPKEGLPAKDDRMHVSELGPGKVDVSLWLEHDHQDSWRTHLLGTWRHGSATSLLHTSGGALETWPWLEAQPIESGASQVRYSRGRRDGSWPSRYYLVDVQGIPTTEIAGHLSYDPAKPLDLIKIRATEISAPEKEPPIGSFDFDTKTLEANNQIPEVSDGLQMWIEPVTESPINGTSPANP